MFTKLQTKPKGQNFALMESCILLSTKSNGPSYFLILEQPFPVDTTFGWLNSVQYNYCRPFHRKRVKRFVKNFAEGITFLYVWRKKL